MDQKLLSICIPTRGRINILKNTLDSIFSFQVEVPEYEVVIYDSSDDNELNEIILKDYNYSNLIYKKGENSGFLNLIKAIEMGNGSFLKLHNDYSRFDEGGLDKILELIKFNLKEKPVLFFANNSLKNILKSEFNSFDTFLYNVSYFSTWSTAFGIWKKDFDKIKNININHMFPHTSLLFELSNKRSYVINNEEIFCNQNIPLKGGYNLFKTFAVDYLDMLSDCLKNKQISQQTFKHIKRDMFLNFFSVWYCHTMILKNEYTFILSGIKQSMHVHYSRTSYYIMILFAYYQAFRIILRKIGSKFKKIVNKYLKIFI